MSDETWFRFWKWFWFALLSVTTAITTVLLFASVALGHSMQRWNAKGNMLMQSPICRDRPFANGCHETNYAGYVVAFTLAICLPIIIGELIAWLYCWIKWKKA